MPTLNSFRQVMQVTQVVMRLAAQMIRRARLRLRTRVALAAENLFLQQQLALYQEPKGNWRRDMNAIRFTLVWLSYWFDWEPALTIVQPQTFKRWHRQGWRLLWTQPARPGRPPIPPELQALIRRMARENVTWGQKRIANEFLLKLGLRVSPRTVRKYMPSACVGSPGRRCQAQRWSTFIRNQARGLIISGFTAQITQKVKAV
jgi:putative transposase